MSKKRPTNPRHFFTEEEKEQIIQAIQEAEKETSGEIRLHVEEKAKKDVFQRALEVFHKIGMHKTAQRNGVLIYLATRDRKFAILGDEGINKVVPEDFWEDIVEEMRTHFKKDQFCEGICKAIEKVGHKLKSYFPYQQDDINELSDEISFDK